MSSKSNLDDVFLGLKHPSLTRFFPFYIALDSNGKITGVGESLKKSLPQIDVGLSIQDFFRVSQPDIDLNPTNLSLFSNDVMIWESIHPKHNLRLKGQCFFSEGSDDLIFVSSPHINNISDLKDINLTVNDFALYDPTVNLVFLLQSQKKSVEQSQRLISELRENQEKLFHQEELSRSSEEKIRAVFDTAMEGIIVIDSQGQIQMTNPAACDIFGYRAEELVGSAVTKLMPEKFAKKDLKYLARYLSSGESSVIGQRRDVVALKKNGEEFPVILSVAEVKTQKEHLFTGIIRDLSQERLLEAQVIQSSKLASLGEMSSGVAHELNNPLHFIKGFNNRIKALFRKKKSITFEDVSEYLESIDQNCERMRKIIQHFRDFSRQSQKKFSPVKINEILLGSFTLLNEQLRLRNVKVSKVLCSENPVVLGDANRLEQVFINLIANARDALEDCTEPELCVESRIDDKKVFIKIADNGSGIPTGKMDKIFNPFFTTKDVGKGTGLGLSISHGIISEHGGEIFCESEVNKGTTFTIVLNVHEEKKDVDEVA